MTTQAAIPAVPFWVNGRRVAPVGGREGAVTDSATGRTVRTVPFATAGDVDAAVRDARAAFPRGATPRRSGRARILMRFRDLLEQRKGDIARVVTEEHGKTLADAAGSVQRGLEVVEFASGIPTC